jgi:Rrf2 family cysteine metabolism transcriptional repressor
MKISTKGRYALALMMYLAQNYHNGDYLAAANISNHLSISKTYLEQVLELLKRGQMVNSVKEGQDGYQLAQMPQNITVYDI